MNKATNIDDYISSFPENTKLILNKIRSLIKKTVPNAEEAISYGIPTFKLNGNLIHFAAFEKHIGIYPGTEAIEIFKDKLKNLKTSKGTIQFPLDTPIDYDLIKEITEYRVSKNSKQ